MFAYGTDVYLESISYYIINAIVIFVIFYLTFYFAFRKSKKGNKFKRAVLNLVIGFNIFIGLLANIFIFNPYSFIGLLGFVLVYFVIYKKFNLGNKTKDIGDEYNDSKKQKSGYALPSFIMSLLAFIPIFGVLIGIVAIIFGVVSLKEIKKKKLDGKRFAVWGIVLGSLGILFTFIIYGSLFYFGFKSDSGPFTESKVELNRKMITQNAAMLELYKKDIGRYPQELKDIDGLNFDIYSIDAYQQPFYYSLSEDGESYDLISIGPDKELGTLDDVIWPFYTGSLSDR